MNKFFSILLACFLATPLLSMTHEDAPQKRPELIQVIQKLTNKVKMYEEYIEDSIDYIIEFKANFDSSNICNIENYNNIIKKLNNHEKQLALEVLTAPSKSTKSRVAPGAYRNVVRGLSLDLMAQHFDSKITLRRESLLAAQHIIKALNNEDINLVFYSLLSIHWRYFMSRSSTLLNDKSPTLSACSDAYSDYQKEIIDAEINKYALYLDFFRELHPYIDKNNKAINTLLQNFPVLSSYLLNPTLNFDLDAFCVDALVNPQILEPASSPELEGFMQRNSLALYSSENVKAVSKVELAKTIKIWQDIYGGLVAQHAPRAEQKEETKVSAGPRKKNKSRKIKSKNKAKAKKPAPKAATSTAKDIMPETEKNSALETKESNAVKEEPVKSEPPKAAPALKSKATKLEPQVALSAGPIAPATLNNRALYRVSSQHYSLLSNLLEGKLKPTTRYEDILSALKSIGVIVENRGNGDYRKLILPNKRKIFIYKPAVPQVGHRFIKRLLDGINEKWDLSVDDLEH